MKTSEKLALNCCNQGCNRDELVAEIEVLEDIAAQPFQTRIDDHVAELEYLAFVVRLMKKQHEGGFEGEVLRLVDFAFAQLEKCSDNINMEAAEEGIAALSNQYAANHIRRMVTLIHKDDLNPQEILDYAQAVEDGEIYSTDT